MAVMVTSWPDLYEPPEVMEKEVPEKVGHGSVDEPTTTVNLPDLVPPGQLGVVTTQ